jgi:hypothetical protein
MTYPTPEIGESGESVALDDVELVRRGLDEPFGSAKLPQGWSFDSHKPAMDALDRLTERLRRVEAVSLLKRTQVEDRDNRIETLETALREIAEGMVPESEGLEGLGHAGTEFNVKFSAWMQRRARNALSTESPKEPA